jgi:hypothetical protein
MVESPKEEELSGVVATATFFLLDFLRAGPSSTIHIKVF